MGLVCLFLLFCGGGTDIFVLHPRSEFSLGCIDTLSGSEAGAAQLNPQDSVYSGNWGSVSASQAD